MSIQDDIDLIDPTKPINPPATKTAPKPTTSSVRANFAALKNAVQGLLDELSGMSGSSLSSLLLTGVSFATATAITATDNALEALGKLQAQIDLKQNALGFTAENSANKGAANGYTPLNASIKIDPTYLPDSLLGALIYQTSWNADTNTPTLPTASAGNKGYYWIVSTLGTTNISGITDWKVGDWVVSNGTTYDKIDNTDAISLFNGRIGAITLLDTDVSDVLNAVAAKTTPVDADIISILDSEASNVLKKVTLTNLWVWVKAKADTFYQEKSPKLTDIAALTPTNGYVLTGNGTTWTSAVASGGSAYVGNECFPIAISDATTALTVSTPAVTFHFPYAFTVTAIKAGLHVVSSSGLPTFNVYKNGSTFFTTKVSIDANEKTSITAATPAVLDATKVACLAGDAVTFSIDVAGSGAKQATIYICGYATGAV